MDITVLKIRGFNEVVGVMRWVGKDHGGHQQDRLA